MSKGIFIDTKGNIDIRSLGEDKTSFLEELQVAVNGFVEVVRPKGLQHPYCFVCNEEGKILKLEMNIIASALYETKLDVIAGNIVILKEKPDDLEGLDLHDIDLLLPLLALKNQRLLDIASQYPTFTEYARIGRQCAKSLERISLDIALTKTERR